MKGTKSSASLQRGKRQPVEHGCEKLNVIQSCGLGQHKAVGGKGVAEGTA